MAKINMYAIRTGRECGVIVQTWDECSKLVTGFKGAEFKGFTNQAKAKRYIEKTKNIESYDFSLVQMRINSIGFKSDIGILGAYLEKEVAKLKVSIKEHSTKTVTAHATNIAASALAISDLTKQAKKNG